MNLKTIQITAVFCLASFFSANSQIKLGDNALGALQSGVTSFTFSNKDAAALSKDAVRKMDSINTVAPATNGYAVRLNRIFGKHKTENGLDLNYKVYVTKEVNAFATADGSVRVFSGLMDIMDDNQLLAVIGHEIGHVANEDTKDAIKAAYRKAAIVGIAASQSDKIATLTDSQLGQIVNAILDSRFSRKQESEADEFSYNFLKKNGYNVNAAAAAFLVLARNSNGAESDFFTKMLRSHPDPKKRAEIAKKRAETDGLYKAYMQQPINNKTPVIAKVATTKKPKKKK